MSDQRQSPFGAYYEGCLCRECAEVKAQLYANRLDSKNNNDAREMTAEDLGLRSGRWLGDEFLALLGEAYWDFAFGRRKAPEAPYAFWLGAVDPDAWDCA